VKKTCKSVKIMLMSLWPNFLAHLVHPAGAKTGASVVQGCPLPMYPSKMFLPVRESGPHLIRHLMGSRKSAPIFFMCIAHRGLKDKVRRRQGYG